MRHWNLSQSDFEIASNNDTKESSKKMLYLQYVKKNTLKFS